MSEHVLAQLAVSNRVLKRAQYEAFAFTVLDEGVLVRNGSYTNPEDHEYLVTVTGGLPTHCSCPADRQYEPACKHRLAVAIREPVLEAARRTESPAVADGGTEVTRPTESQPDEPPEWCDCAGLRDGFPCFECYRRGRKELPED
ncbi:SWIM zinc finger family protein [Halorarius halobius]|uniref:SWIM zinc finger family protein n=1 Tax=Halorarius halobius TaxID=2962671 RepID=UPI0020CD8EAD|nr:SWIM zinc finger family protein [Halorarius halobius]